MADAGRILIIPKGDYVADVAYERLDLVRHNGNVWLAKKDTTGVEPSADSDDWFFMGNTDALTLGTETPEEWQAKIDAKAEGTHTHDKTEVGLENVDNTADAEKRVLYAETAGVAESVAWENITDRPESGDSAHTHTIAQITDFPATMPPSAHTQDASTITAGTLAGEVVANAEAVAVLEKAQVRNFYFGTEDMEAGVSELPAGNVYFVYEEVVTETTE